MSSWRPCKRVGAQLVTATAAVLTALNGNGMFGLQVTALALPRQVRKGWVLGTSQEPWADRFLGPAVGVPKTVVF